MARRRRERMSEGKKNIIAGLIQEYNIKSAEDIQEALKDLLGGTIQEMMEAELDEHLGYDEYERSDNSDYRNGVKHKKILRGKRFWCNLYLNGSPCPEVVSTTLLVDFYFSRIYTNIL